MTEETLMSIEGSHERAAIASHFKQFAEQLEADGSVTFSTDTDEVSLSIPETAEFELEIESETEAEETEYEIEFEIEWSTEETEPAEQAALTISGEPAGQQETVEEAEPAASDEREAAEEGEEGGQ